MPDLPPILSLVFDHLLPILAWAALLYLAVRWLFRFWESKLASDRSFRLTFPVSPMVFLSRRIVISYLINDDLVQAEIRRLASQENTHHTEVEKRAQQYAQEIVPSFKAVFYFSIGYWLARVLLLTMYRTKLVRNANDEYAKIGRDATVVLFMNHRSNIDVLLVNYLLSRHSAVSHAAGEWARLWPLHHLVKMAGNYVVDRETDDPLYRLVLKRYVQMSVANGIHLGIFPEGGLTRDGHIQDLNFGLLNYVTTASWPGQNREVIFIPVSFNYDRVPEQQGLVFSSQSEYRHRGKLSLALSTLSFCFRMLCLPFTPRHKRFGWACASMGEPVSLTAWQRARGIEFQSLTLEQKRSHIQELGQQMMGSIKDSIPVLPTHVLAMALLEQGELELPQVELLARAAELQRVLLAAGAPVFTYDLDFTVAYSQALKFFADLGLAVQSSEQCWSVTESQRAMLHYYANSIGHFLDPSYVKTQVTHRAVESAQASARNKVYLSTMLESYDRVLINAKEQGFFARFYENFLQSSPRIVEKFKNVDMLRLQQHLRLSLEHIQDFFIKARASKRLRTVAQIHSKSRLDIAPELYQFWLQSLLHTVAEYDHQFDSQVELSWRAVMMPGIDFMCSQYAADPAPLLPDLGNNGNVLLSIEEQGIARWIDHWGDRAPDNIALISDSRTLTYGGLANEVRRLAGALQQQLGVGAKDRVGFLATNRVEFITLTFACARIGAILVPINFRLSAQEQKRFIKRAAIKALFVDKGRQAVLPSGAVDCQQILLDDASSLAAEIGYQQIVAAAEPLNTNLGTMDSPLFILFTSGSTGEPKGAVLSQRSVHWNALNSRLMHDMQQLDLIATTLPFFHAGGINIQTLPAMQVGATVRIFSDFVAHEFMQFVIQKQPTLTVLVPTQMQMLMNLPDWFTQDMSSLRAVTTGSTIISKELIRAWSDKGVPVIQIYGCTESGPIAVHQTVAGIKAGLGTVGHAAMYTEFKLVDDSGAVVEQGAEGEILLRGPNIMSHYWQDEAATAQAIQDGWLLTGDIGYQDENGRLHIAGRKKRLLISGGENIHPAEIEQVLELHQLIQQAAVVGVADPKWGEIPVALIVPVAGAELSEKVIREYLDQHLGRYKHPRHILFETELPLTPLDKIAYPEIAKIVQLRLA